MKTPLLWLRKIIAVVVCTSLAACASNGEPKLADPGTKKWYEQRIQEIEMAKAEGNITQDEYLALRKETEDTRAEYVAAEEERRQSTVGVGIGFSTGGWGHHHHR